MTIIQQIHRDREDLARVLKNHAGIRRIVEDLYPDTAHFIYELLQNAEDASASETVFVLSPDDITFEHNGRPFDEADIRAITDIGVGTKRVDDDNIGQFGIGFKAVFQYSETPRIWSPKYSFEISDMVLPSELTHDPALGASTRFEFPFNSSKKLRAQAFSEVQEGLEQISDSTLLFLSHIEEIQWHIHDGQKGHLLRIPHSDHHIEILREIDGNPTQSSHYLRFTEPVDGLEHLYVAVAYELQPQHGNGTSYFSSHFSESFKIVPAEKGRVAVFFTATKETSNLRFHLHAPFVPELSRSSIKDTPVNTPLIHQLAKLTTRSLFSIRDIDLLNRDFLAVLPNSQDMIPPTYCPIRDAVVEAMNCEPLTPKHSGGHAPANQLLQAEAGLKKLLDCNDLHFLTDSYDELTDWAVAATQRNNNVDRFLTDLDICRWDVSNFLTTFEKRFCIKNYNTNEAFSRLSHHRYSWDYGYDHQFLHWISRKPDDWHRAMYALFHHELKAKLYRFNGVCLVKCSDGEYRTGDECYFPTREMPIDPIHPRVAEATYSGGGSKSEQVDARSFLEGIGVCEIGNFQQITAILEQRYAEPSLVPKWKDHVADLRRFIALVDEDRESCGLFKDYYIFQSADGRLHKPCNLYLDSPFIDTGLHAYYDCLGANSDCKAIFENYKSVDYVKKFTTFALACGTADKLKITKVSCKGNPEKEYLYSAPGSQFTNTGIDSDYVIHGLERIFETPDIELSRLVWSTLVDKSKDKNFLKATYRYNQSNNPHTTDSQLVQQLKNISWIPQIDGEFVRPAEALSDRLPDGFPYDPGWQWICAISFGANNEKHVAQERKVQELAAELGFDDETTFNDCKEFAKYDSETRKKFLNEHKHPTKLPNRQSKNSTKRAQLVRDEALVADERITENRQRSVSVNRDAIKRERAIPYLRDMYTHTEGVTICQACKDQLPFKLSDGEYYFEAVEFLPDLMKHYYQNYLALCPNHAAMYKYANSSSDHMINGFTDMKNCELALTLADQPVTIYFTGTHIEDIRIIILTDRDR